MAISKEGIYIYCIINSDRPRTFGPLGIGGRGDELYTISWRNIAAVVSNSPIISYSVSRENMISHEKAIEEVMKSHTVLPVKFCTIARDDAKVREILERERDKFEDLLEYFEGKKELGLKVVFKDIIYGHILDKYTDIKALKEKIAALPFAKTQPYRMEIGRMVEAALEKEKEQRKEDILNTLSSLAVEVKTNKNYGEMMILSAAFLVEKDKEADFDQMVNKLDAKYVDKVKFKYVGTLPPFNFVNLVIEMDISKSVTVDGR